MHVKCEYNLKYGRTMFNCPNCWLLPGLCICERVQRCQPRTKVVVHVHHKEWGKSSNTGSIAALSIPGSEILIKGYKPHDARVHEMIEDQSHTTAILWPGADSISCSELKQIADERTKGRIAVIAVDATWNNAMRMRSFYPDDTLQVKLAPDSPLIIAQRTSLLSPVRKYRGDKVKTGRVSTLEAIAALLYELEGDEEVADTLLDNLRMKVDACRVQRNKPSVYGTLSEEDLIQY